MFAWLPDALAKLSTRHRSIWYWKRRSVSTAALAATRASNAGAAKRTMFMFAAIIRSPDQTIFARQFPPACPRWGGVRPDDNMPNFAVRNRMCDDLFLHHSGAVHG